MERTLSYADISLVPQKCMVDSRAECDTSVQFGKYTFDLPVYAANMKSVVDENTCIFLAKNKCFYTMHRFGVDNRTFCEKMLSENLFTSISTGIKQDSYDDLKRLKEAKIDPDYITLDVANAWSVKTIGMARWIKDNFSSFLIVGNISTKEAIEDINLWGLRIDAYKVGQCAGRVCISKNKTGFSRKMVTALLDCVPATDRPIIADGGISEHGDIAKATCLGSKLVMCGSLFAAYDQSAGSILDIEEVQYKEYFGSASSYNKEEQKNIEGKKILIRYRGSMDKLLKEIKEDLQSAISYGGGKCLADLRKVPWEIN